MQNLNAVITANNRCYLL